MKLAFSKTVVAAFSLLMALAASSPACFAWCGTQWNIIDGTTICAWKRTWHGPNALATPLRGYYIPRKPSCFACEGFAVDCGFIVDDSFASWDCRGEYPGGEPGQTYPIEAGTGFEPVQFERLGQVPNDLEPGAAATAGAATH